MISFEKIIPLLVEAKVEFIVIGGFSAALHGSARSTQDLDIVYARSTSNLRALATALAPLHPYLRGAPPGLPFSLDEQTLKSGLNFTLTTDFGSLDLLGEVLGGGTYDQLRASSSEVEIFGVRCFNVNLLKLIELKNAAGRPKDLEAIAELKLIAESISDGDEV